jgi:hypothetical protein
MGSQQSLPREEADQYALVQSWVPQTEARLDWLKSQGEPCDSPEYREALEYYAQLLRAKWRWEFRESEHCDCLGEKRRACSHGPVALLSLAVTLLSCHLLLVHLRSRHQNWLSALDREATAYARATVAG